MIKNFLRYTLYFLILIIIVIFYLSFVGIQTKSFNNLIKEEVLKTNSKINIELNTIRAILRLKDFSLNLETLEPRISYNSKEVILNKISTNFSLVSFFNKKFSIDDLEISTKEIKLNDLITLVRAHKDDGKLYILQKLITKGLISIKLDLNFNEKGNLKNNYVVKGVVKNVKLKLPKKNKIQNLNFDFLIKDKEYLITNITSQFQDIKLQSKQIKINKKKKNFLVSGDISNLENKINAQLIDLIFNDYSKKFNNINFKSNNNFSLRINSDFKVSNLEIDSKIKIKNLDYNFSSKIVQKYFPTYKDLLKFKEHEIFVTSKKNKIIINGKGKIMIDGKIDTIKYKITKNNENYQFNSDFNLKENSILVDFLNYKKKENVESLLSVEGLFKKGKILLFKKIRFTENKNELFIKNLNLNKNFKINEIDNIKLNFLNQKNIQNQINLSKLKNDYEIIGESFDATFILDQILKENEDTSGSASILNNFSSTIKFDIQKIFLDEETPVYDFLGTSKFKNNELIQLNIESKFIDDKKLKITVNTNKDNEKITTLFSGNAKPLVKKYKFIKGFEGGVLDFYSIKNNNKSVSKLKIYNFKLNEVPALTKILTLASLQGIADLLTGEGIRFNEYEMSFSNTKKLMTIDEIYAIGPSISILMNGYIESEKLISLRGTLVPATTINKVIGSIPFFGDILVGKKTGEGVFGVSFKIKGPPKDLKTTVNPIKTLTPRFITRTLENIKKD